MYKGLDALYDDFKSALRAKNYSKIIEYGAQLSNLPVYHIHPDSLTGELVRDATDLAFYAIEHPSRCLDLSSLFNRLYVEASLGIDLTMISGKTRVERDKNCERHSRN